MPKWGPTLEELDGTSPWGINKWWLEPGKTITDPVHGDIYVNRFEQALIDSKPMQRLRRVRQLGTTHLVYPGAVHTRFSHSLGTLRAAQDLLDAVVDNRRNNDRPRPDLLDEWHEDHPAVLRANFAEATVLARLGALLHDIGHVPLGHTIEDDLDVLAAHDKNETRFNTLWEQIDPTVRHVIDSNAELKTELRHLILSKVEMEKGWKSKYPFVEDIVGNTICADLMDYLQRDHYYTGLPMRIGHRFLDHFYVMPSTDVRHGSHMVIRTTRHGQERQDVKTELEKYLRYRYELTERVLTHHAKTSADAMIGKLLEIWSDITWLEIAAQRYGSIVAGRVGEDIAAIQKAVIEAHPEAKDAIKQAVRSRLESEFLKRSDDGILEHLIDLADSRNTDQWQAVRHLAEAVLDRRLFKRAARADSPEDLAEASDIWKDFGSAEKRRELEREAARLVNVSPGWSVVIWLPKDTMRLKVAQVLVDGGNGAVALSTFGGPSEQIVKAHRHLWAITVYVRPELMSDSPHQVAAMLGYLKDCMNVALHDHEGRPVVGFREYAANMVAEMIKMSPEHTRDLHTLARLPIAAAGSPNNFESTLREVWEQARINDMTSDQFPTLHWTDWPQPN